MFHAFQQQSSELSPVALVQLGRLLVEFRYQLFPASEIK